LEDRHSGGLEAAELKRKIFILFAARKVTIASLQNAHLSKEEFVKEMSNIHGYDLKRLLQTHYTKMDIFRTYVLFVTALTLYHFPIEHWGASISAKDLRFIFDLIGF